MPIPEAPACEECGSTPIFHKMTYYSILIDDFLLSFLNPGIFANFFQSITSRVERALSRPILMVMIKLRLAELHTEKDEKTSLLGETLWNEAVAQGISLVEVRPFGLPKNMFIATLPRGKKLVYEGIPGIRSDIHRVPWMDDKFELKERFAKLGFPVAKGGKVTSLKKAVKLYRTLNAPVVAKPNAGSFSRHTIMHIKDEKELARGFTVAHQVSPEVVIEEELKGRVYRATVVNDKVIGVIRRDQPAVVGDDIHTVRELVQKENQHPLRKGPHFGPILLDARAEKELAWQGLTLESVLLKDRRATLHQKINWTVGGTTTDVTDEVHPDNVQLFIDATRVTKASINGIDFIVDDISHSWKQQERCGILECNSMPLFENHHLPFYGKPRNVAKPIWEMVIAEEQG